MLKNHSDAESKVLSRLLRLWLHVNLNIFLFPQISIKTLFCCIRKKIRGRKVIQETNDIVWPGIRVKLRLVFQSGFDLPSLRF